MSKKTKLTTEESNLFKANLKGVIPLQQDKELLTPKKLKAPTKHKSTTAKTTVDYDISVTDISIPTVNSEETLKYMRPGLQTNIMRKLNRGSIPIDAEIDLHGLTISQAEHSLQRFLLTAKHKHYRCIRIIHGKGRNTKQDHPILKNKVNVWLRSNSQVLAFCSAKPKDGGTGAVYVLLKTTIGDKLSLEN